MEFSGALSDEQFWSEMARVDESVRVSFASKVTFGIANWPGVGSIGEWGFHVGPRTLLFGQGGSEVLHGIYTDEDRQPRDFARQLRLAERGLIHGGFDDHRHADIVQEVPDEVHVLPVDDVPVVFEVWTDAAATWGEGHLGNHSIVFRSLRGMDDTLMLTRIRDIEPYIAGRNEWISRVRSQGPPAPGVDEDQL